MTFDFSSLKHILLSLAHDATLDISMLVKFSASLLVSPFTPNIRSSANAIAFVLLLKFRFNMELYWIFQNPGPQHDPCGYPFVTSLSKVAVLLLK